MNILKRLDTNRSILSVEQNEGVVFFRVAFDDALASWYNSPFFSFLSRI